MNPRAAPSRYHALDQPGFIILQCRASCKALSPSPFRSQQRLRLANMVASNGSISMTCIYNQQACAQFNSLCGPYSCLLVSSMCDTNVTKPQSRMEVSHASMDTSAQHFVLEGQKLYGYSKSKRQHLFNL
jgi:hypothetical protein